MRLAGFHTVLWILVIAGFYLRIQGVGAVGYNLDEVEKAQAAELYLAGDFFVDMEHPMLLKSLLALVFALVEPHGESSEGAARTLFALLGAGTILLLYLLAARLFHPMNGFPTSYEALTFILITGDCLLCRFRGLELRSS